MPVHEPRADWFLEAVASALEERDCELELLVVADGEGGSVEALLEGIEDPRLRLLVVEPGSTSKLLELVGEREDVVAYGATLICDETLQPVQTVTSTLEGDVAEA